MTSLAVASYNSVCAALGEKPIPELEELLRSGIERVDVSKMYLPRKHFQCMLRLLEEQPEIQQLVLDGTRLQAEDVSDLLTALSRSCISSLSLRNVKLEAASANALRQFCMSNQQIYEVHLDGTCIPSSKIEEIEMIVNLNRLNAEALLSPGVVPVGGTPPQTDRWQICRERHRLDQLPEALASEQPSSAIIDDFVMSRETVFCDTTFPPQHFCFPLSTISTIRWKSLSETGAHQADQPKQGDSACSESAFYHNAFLCAALNALRAYEDLTQSILLKGYPKPGLYVFRLFVDGEAREIVVDDTLPCLFSGDECFLVGISSCCYPFYAALLEKAVAKAVGGYDRIEKLSFCDCVEMLTGSTCFDIDLTARTFNTTAAFGVLRLLTEKGHKLVACPVARSQREALAFESDGIGGGLPYTILKADVCQKNGAHYAYVVQISTPFANRALKYAFEWGEFQSSQINGKLVVWMTLEDFAVVFQQLFLIMWSYDDAAAAHKVMRVFSAISSFPATSSRFADNCAFFLENKSNGPSGVMVSVQSDGAYNEDATARCLFHKYAEMGGGKLARRYDVGAKNALFQSHDFCGSEGSIFFALLPREKLQMTVAANFDTRLTVRFSMLESVNLADLQSTMLSFFFSCTWNTIFFGKRLSEKLIVVTNESRECNTHSVLALSQRTKQEPFFPIGALGWVGAAADVVMLSSPQFSTVVERSVTTLHNIFLPILPGESLFLVPFCIGTKCVDEFELTVFTERKMALSCLDTTLFL